MYSSLGFGIKLESAGPGVREVYRGLGLWEPDISGEGGWELSNCFSSQLYDDAVIEKVCCDSVRIENVICTQLD
jgi:hypothetical protein